MKQMQPFLCGLRGLRVGCLIVTSLCLVFGAVRAAESWEAERDRLLGECDGKIEAELEKRITPQGIAALNGIKWPVNPPVRPLTDVYQLAQKRSQELAAKVYTPEKESAVAADVIKKYSQFVIGEEITFSTNVKFAARVTGKLRSVSPGRIRVGNRWLNTEADLDPETRDRFYPDACAALQKKKLELALRKFHLEKEEYRRKQYLIVLPELLRENGYQPLEIESDGSFSLETSNWISRKEFLDNKVEDARDAAENEVRKQVTSQYMTSRGYVYDATAEEWLPKGYSRKKETQEQPKPGFFQRLKNAFSN